MRLTASSPAFGSGANPGDARHVAFGVPRVAPAATGDDLRIGNGEAFFALCRFLPGGFSARRRVLRNADGDPAHAREHEGDACRPATSPYEQVEPRHLFSFQVRLIPFQVAQPRAVDGHNTVSGGRRIPKMVDIQNNVAMHHADFWKEHKLKK